MSCFNHDTAIVKMQQQTAWEAHPLESETNKFEVNYL